MMGCRQWVGIRLLDCEWAAVVIEGQSGAAGTPENNRLNYRDDAAFTDITVKAGNYARHRKRLKHKCGEQEPAHQQVDHVLLTVADLVHNEGLSES